MRAIGAIGIAEDAKRCLFHGAAMLRQVMQRVLADKVLFRRFLGVSPHQYLRRRKMALAAAYLLERGGRVQDAAARVGMDDPYHFSRAFKAVHGVPPSALLAARR